MASFIVTGGASSINAAGCDISWPLEKVSSLDSALEDVPGSGYLVGVGIAGSGGGNEMGSRNESGAVGGGIGDGNGGGGGGSIGIGNEGWWKGKNSTTLVRSPGRTTAILSMVGKLYRQMSVEGLVNMRTLKSLEGVLCKTSYRCKKIDA